MSGDGDGDADAAVTTERAALALGPLKVRNSQEFAILVTLLVASVLLLTLVVIGLLCCCGSCWHYVSEQWWRLARKLRRQPSAGPSSRKVCIDDAESKIRSGLTNPAFDSTLLDLGEEPPLRVVTSSPEQGPGPQDTPTSARVAREMYRTRTQSSAESVSSEAPLVASRKPSESGAESPLVRSSVGTPVAVRSNSVRIPTDLGTIDPSLYEEWQAPSSSTLVTTASRKISVLPRSHSAAGSQNAGGSAHVDARGKLYLSLKYDKADCKLIVTIQRAEALPIRDFSGTVDSFVKVLLLPDRKPKYQTKTQKKTIEPVFNETFEFTVQPDQLPLRTLVFSVHDFDRFSRSCLLGSCAIDMSAIHTQITHDSIDFDVLITNVCTAGLTVATHSVSPFSSLGFFLMNYTPRWPVHDL